MENGIPRNRDKDEWNRRDAEEKGGNILYGFPPAREWQRGSGNDRGGREWRNTNVKCKNPNVKSMTKLKCQMNDIIKIKSRGIGTKTNGTAETQRARRGSIHRLQGWDRLCKFGDIIIICFYFFSFINRFFGERIRKIIRSRCVEGEGEEHLLQRKQSFSVIVVPKLSLGTRIGKHEFNNPANRAIGKFTIF